MIMLCENCGGGEEVAVDVKHVVGGGEEVAIGEGVVANGNKHVVVVVDDDDDEYVDIVKDADAL